MKLCDYGCGKEAKYYFKYSNTHCCSTHYRKCPEQRRKNTKKIKIEADILHQKCSYCEKPAKVYFHLVDKYCCEKYLQQCPSQKVRLDKQNVGVQITNETLLCDYGCGKIAKFQLKKGKLCCSERPQSCSNIREKNSEKNQISQAGERNAMWRGGISFGEYHKDFSESIKRFIKKRDNYKCMNLDCSKKFKTLHVHHIDYDKKNTCEKNLITVCVSCHGKTMINREYWKMYYGNIIRNIYNS